MMGVAKIDPNFVFERSEPPLTRNSCRFRECKPNLETTPCGTIEKFGMVGRRDRENMCRQTVDLKKERANNAFHFAVVVNIAAFLTHRVELVEEQNGMPLTSVVKHF